MQSPLNVRLYQDMFAIKKSNNGTDIELFKSNDKWGYTISPRNDKVEKALIEIVSFLNL